VFEIDRYDTQSAVSKFINHKVRVSVVVACGDPRQEWKQTARSSQCHLLGRRVVSDDAA
jgi:hypothetical protein